MQRGVQTFDGVCPECQHTDVGGLQTVPGETAEQQPQGNHRAGLRTIPRYQDAAEASQRQYRDEQQEESELEVEAGEASIVGDPHSAPTRQRQPSELESDADARRLAQDEELNAAQLEAATQASLQEHWHQQQQLVDRVANMDLEDYGREYSQKEQQALVRSAQEFHQQAEEAEHQAKLESLRSYTEDLSRQHARNKGSHAPVAKAEDTYSRPGPSGTSRSGRDAVNKGDHRSQNETIEPQSPRTAVRQRWSRSNLPQTFPSPAQSEATVGSARQVQSPPRYQGLQQAPRPIPNEASTGYDWTRPASQIRSPSPTITIRTAESQRSGEDYRRNNLFSRHPGRPMHPLAQPNPRRRTAHDPHATSTVVDDSRSTILDDDVEEIERSDMR